MRRSPASPSSQARAGERPSAAPADDAKTIGDRLRRLRVGRNLTINTLAKRAGVPASTISKIENGLLKPSLVHAINLATALEENLGFLVDRYRAEPQRTSIVYARQREKLEFPDMGLTLHDLSGRFNPGVLEARYGVLKAGAHSGRAPMTHPGDEICCVVKGAITFHVGGEHWTLAAGDTIHFKSDLPHRWENAARGRTEVIWVFSDGLSF
ncbi:MAG: helix-turn-helix transcriptional regulator [Rhodospirillaceae bacterium]|nr:helix-turn-helix transcriptional regulator [Rhodospirillaceae bacterium]